MVHRKLATAATLILLTIGIAACGPGSDSTSSESSSSGEIKTVVSELGDVNLTVWGVAEAEPQLKPLTEAFEKKYPNVSVDLVFKGYNELASTSKLVVSSDDAPDVLTTDAGLTGNAPLVQGGLLSNLQPYADAYGWDKAFNAVLLRAVEFTDDGKIGEGNLYGVPQFGEMVGLYYNRAKLQELGIKLPTTLEEFEAAMQKAKDAGEVPLQFGNLDQQLGNHLYASILNSLVGDASEITDAVFSSTPLPRDSAVAAAQKMVDWADAGYFPDDYAGVKELTAVERFSNGEGVFLIDGTWANPQLSKELGDDLGFFAMPRAGGGTAIATGGGSLPFVVPTSASSTDAAAAYIDYVTGEANTDISLKTSQLPALPPSGDFTAPNQGLQEVLGVWDRSTREDTLVPYLAYLTPTFWDTLLAKNQELLAGKLSPDEFVDELDDDVASSGS